MNNTANESPTIIYIYSSYTEAQKRAIKKYRENNRSKINDHMKEYYNKQKQLDPDFMQKKRDQAKKTYYKKKALLQNNI
jgi:hypothetical protein